MSTKTYTSRDLLRLRHTPVGKGLHDQLHKRLQKNAELVEICRMPIERSLPLIKEEPPNTSGDSDDFEPAKKSLSRQLDGTDSEWKYRGRTESEQAETQPIPAPTGLAAQKDEGFQRFYKAVVSPTHVRVTAGGRIVPNTRGASSPTAKWIKAKISGEGALGARPVSRDAPEQANAMPSAGFIGPQPLFSNFVPSMMAPGFPHIPGAYPVMPWQMGFNLGNAFGLPTPALGQPVAPTAPAQGSSKLGKQGEPTTSENQVPLRLSPPDQFDPNRPFFFNGQWLWSHYYPFGMPGAPGIPSASMLGPATASHRFGLNPMMVPQSPRTAQPGSTQLPSMPTSPLPMAPNHVVPAKPPISSIRPSEITKKQIDVLRGSLRYFEDQLQYNKHQIDEKGMEHQAQIIRQQIQQFEKNLEAQLAFEEGNYPRVDTREDSNSSSSSQSGVQPKTAAAAYMTSVPGNDGISSSRDDSSVVVRNAKSQSSQERSCDSSQNLGNSNKSTSALAISGACINSPSSVRTIRKVSSLPVTAALAPPFQPRLDGAMPLSSGHKSRRGNEEECLSASVSSAITSSRNFSEANLDGGPYLVGRLPSDIHPEHAKDTDYIYPRQLTEDELRARHMYWGKAPHNLQSGLPKFDGKDFYPPSPSRGSSSGSKSLIGTKVHNAQIEACRGSNARSTVNKEMDPFLRAPAQHGSKTTKIIARQILSEQGNGEGSIGSNHSEASKAKTLRPSARSAGNIRILVSSSEGPSAGSPSGNGLQSHENDDHDEDRNLIFKGRNSLTRNGTRTHNEIWQSMMRRGTSSANAVQGTVTSMTAQGVLPQYAGHATASLAPAITNASASSRSSASRPGNHREVGTVSPAVEKQAENRPPAGEHKFNAQRSTSALTRAAPTI